MHTRSVVNSSLFAILPAMLTVLATCGTAGDLRPVGGPVEVSVGAEDNGGRVELEPGQVLVLTLASNPSTGYSWEVVEAKDSVLRQTGEAEFKSDSALESPPPGTGGVEILRFKAGETGETPLRLVYHRPWEKGAKPEETYSLQVEVR